MISFIDTAYFASGLIVIALYLPQLVMIGRDRNGCPSTCLTTWWIWSVCAAIGVTYSVVVNHDLLVIEVSVGGAIGCLATAALATYKRVRYGLQR